MEKNPSPHRGIEPTSAACRSDAVPTELHPPPTLPLGIGTSHEMWTHLTVLDTAVCIYFFTVLLVLDRCGSKVFFRRLANISVSPGSSLTSSSRKDCHVADISSSLGLRSGSWWRNIEAVCRVCYSFLRILLEIPNLYAILVSAVTCGFQPCRG